MKEKKWILVNLAILSIKRKWFVLFKHDPAVSLSNKSTTLIERRSNAPKYFDFVQFRFNRDVSPLRTNKDFNYFCRLKMVIYFSFARKWENHLALILRNGSEFSSWRRKLFTIQLMRREAAGEVIDKCVMLRLLTDVRNLIKYSNWKKVNCGRIARVRWVHRKWPYLYHAQWYARWTSVQIFEEVHTIRSSPIRAHLLSVTHSARFSLKIGYWLYLRLTRAIREMWTMKKNIKDVEKG